MANEYEERSTLDDEDPTRGAGEREPELDEDEDDPTRGAGEREPELDDEDGPVEDPMRSSSEP
jgi:hypothetical protein